MHANNWKKIPGETFIKKIGGEVVKPDYYSKLSDEKVKDKRR